MKTTAIDTNVLLDFALKRKPRYKSVSDLFQDCTNLKVRIYISLAIFLEAEWVLRSYYKQPKEIITSFFEELILIPNLMTDKKDNLKLSLSLYKNSKQISFTDCMILVQIKNYKSDEFLTFDKNLEKVYNSLL